MPQDPSIPRQDSRPDGMTVVAWGDAKPAPPGQVDRPLAAIGRDRRLPLLLAGFGAVAAVASLVTEWLVMTVPNGGPTGNTVIRVPGGVADVGGFGVAYLVGLLGLASAAALALRGTAAVRPNARVAGLGLAAAVLAVLTAAAFSLDDSGQRTLFYAPEDGFRVDYGRGLVSAFVSTALLAAALHLSGRAVAQMPERDEGPGATDGRRPTRGRRRSREDERPPAPADLRVEPAMPFARPEPPR